MPTNTTYTVTDLLGTPTEPTAGDHVVTVIGCAIAATGAYFPLIFLQMHWIGAIHAVWPEIPAFGYWDLFGINLPLWVMLLLRARVTAKKS